MSADGHSADGENEVQQRRRQLMDARSRLTLLRSPAKTLYYFARCTMSGLASTLPWVMSHPVTIFLLVPILGLYIYVKRANYEPDILHNFELGVEYVVWWVGLGVLSSIGLGTGMHSGVLFLFPHMLKVCLAAETCGHVDFDARADMWYRLAPLGCDGGQPPPGGLSLWATYRKVALTAMLWGAGTAIGEIPPYYISYSAAVTGQRNAALAGLQQTLSAKSTPAKGAASATPGAAAAARKPRSSGDAEGLLSSLLTASQDWMLGFIKAHGFRGVLLLASWPNAAFDLCGICCGAFKMPFWKFFGATLIGKALFKANLQALVCMALFRRSSRDALLGGLDAVLPSGASSRLHAFVNDQIARFKVKVAAKTAAHHAGSWFWVRAAETLRSRRRLVEWLGSLAPDSVAEAWSLVMVLLIATFVARCINTFAQGLKAEEDEAEVAALEGRLLAAKRRQQSG